MDERIFQTKKKRESCFDGINLILKIQQTTRECLGSQKIIILVVVVIPATVRKEKRMVSYCSLCADDLFRVKQTGMVLVVNTKIGLLDIIKEEATTFSCGS